MLQVLLNGNSMGCAACCAAPDSRAVFPCHSGSTALRASVFLFRLDSPLDSAACCVATGPLAVMAYPQDKGDKLLCLDAAATVHKVLIRIPATNPFQYKYTDFQPKVYLRAKSQTLLVVRFFRFSPYHCADRPLQGALAAATHLQWHHFSIALKLVVPKDGAVHVLVGCSRCNVSDLLALLLHPAGHEGAADVQGLAGDVPGPVQEGRPADGQPQGAPR